MKIGVIGTGKMGRIHCRVLKELGVLHGVYDQDQITCHTIAKEFNIYPHTKPEDIIGNTDLDGIIIAVPTPYHLEAATACINAGRHVLLEKPMCTTLDEAKQLVDLVKQNDQIVTVGYIERHNPVFKDLNRRVHAGFYNEITSVNIKRVGGIPRSADNVIMDIMTHDINLLITLFGRSPSNIYVHRRESGKIVHSAQALLDFGTASATCEANWVSPTKMRTIAVTGTGGYAEVDMIKQELVQVEEKEKHFFTFNEEPLKNEIQAFINAIQTGNISDIVSIDEAYETLRITTEAAYGENK